MTRIAAGIPANTHPPIGGPAPNAPAEAAAPSGPAAAARETNAPASAGPDRPAPRSSESPRHSTIDLNALRHELARWEGNEPFMYLCRAGYVTTGIGNKLANAQEAIALPWQHRTTGLPATPTEIRTAFDRVAAMTSEFRGRNQTENPYKAGRYEGITDLVLPAATVNQLAIDRLTREFLPGLRRLFPGFDGYPQPAQRALIDMAYTLGVAGLRTKFPNLVEACRLGNFDDAAGECRRKNAQAGRNAATRDLFSEAARLKTSIHTFAREVRP